VGLGKVSEERKEKEKKREGREKEREGLLEGTVFSATNQYFFISPHQYEEGEGRKGGKKEGGGGGNRLHFPTRLSYSSSIDARGRIRKGKKKKRRDRDIASLLSSHHLSM